jgi:tetratricopeptide (TPR) repeat protein
VRALSSLRAALAPALSAALVTTAQAAPSIWDVARDPRLARADQLLALAERSRIPAEDGSDDALFPPSSTSEELNRQLNARAATLINIADGARLGDPRLLFLLGDALVKADKSYLVEGEKRLQQALEAAPEAPVTLLTDAWFSLAIAEGKLRHHEAERAAYSRALELEWQPDQRATIATNRAESSMASGDLGAAIEDYRLALSLSRSGITQALALWGLAVATERDGDLPTALELARKANAYRFGPVSHFVVALDLPSVYFTPEYEEHYYRALATMGEAEAEARPDEARLRWQAASLLWSLYLEGAVRDKERWVDDARRLRELCRQKLARLDGEPLGRGTPQSEPGRHEH